MNKLINFFEIENQIYKLWEDYDAFACSTNSSKPAYSIMMPPPNITGNLHLGHTLNYTLQDIIARFQRLCGYDVLWQPGTDHAGIATQIIVEKMLFKKDLSFDNKIGKDKLVSYAWEWRKENENNIIYQQKRLGISPDWNRHLFTLDSNLSNAVKKAFINLYKDNLIYKDKRLINWDIKLQTAISDLEVINQEAKIEFWYIDYAFCKDNNKFITVATTRPETIFGDVALAVHPEDDRYQKFIGEYVRVPIIDREIPIIGDYSCQPNKGSGVVKITPSHDFKDFEIGKRHNLPIINILDKNGNLVDPTPIPYRGMFFEKAKQILINDLTQKCLIRKVESITSSIPYGDRSSSIIQPILTDQWFLNTKPLAVNAIEVVEKGLVKFTPSYWESTYFEWLYNIQPWCISRQLWWGHSIPAWYTQHGKIVVADDYPSAMNLAYKTYGSNIQLTKDPDVLDTWFSSSLWPITTLGWPEENKILNRYYPTNTLVTGFDIIFFWVARMIMMSNYFMKTVPFHNVYIHALIRDDKGKKMSKSKGNVIDPLDLLNKYGCDSVRLTLTSLSVPGKDIKLSEPRIEGYRNFITKIWNASRFLEINNCFYKDKDEGEFNYNYKESTNSLNNWIINELVILSSSVHDSINKFKFSEASINIYKFFWSYFCDFYIEFLKIAFQEDEYSSEIKEFKKVSNWVFKNFLIISHPFIPFITEYLWNKFYKCSKDTLLMLQKWPDFIINSKNKYYYDDNKEVLFIIQLIKEIRSIGNLFQPNNKPEYLILNESFDNNIFKYQKIILSLTQLNGIKIKKIDSNLIRKNNVIFSIEKEIFILTFSEDIFLEKFLKEIQEEIDLYNQKILKLETKLNNNIFLSKANFDIIEGTKEKLNSMKNIKESKLKYLNLLKNLNK